MPTEYRSARCLYPQRVTHRPALLRHMRVVTNGGNTSATFLNACVPTIRGDALLPVACHVFALGVWVRRCFLIMGAPLLDDGIEGSEVDTPGLSMTNSQRPSG